MKIRNWVLRRFSLLAFKFCCNCGNSVIAAMPRKDGDVIEVNCTGCKASYLLTWHGDHFTFKNSQVQNQEPHPADLSKLSPALQRLIARGSMNKIVKEQLTKHTELLSAFHLMPIHDFVVDDKDHYDEATGKTTPATFDYFSFIRGRRISDETYFYVHIRLDHTIIDAKNALSIPYVESKIVAAIIQFAEYSKCQCAVGAACDRHKQEPVVATEGETAR